MGLELRIRRGTRGIISQTTARGHLVQVLLAAALGAFLGWVVVRRMEPPLNYALGALVVVVLWQPFRDALAWMLATGEQRAAFRAEVERGRQALREEQEQAAQVAASRRGPPLKAKVVAVLAAALGIVAIWKLLG